MKHFNNVKLVSSFREISNVLDIVSMTIRIFTAVLIVLQALLLIRDVKNKTDRIG
ncbi:MAG: hypothetical protein IJ851_06035 [Eubacterium sp.]|nr:hypothetical protein [Eubacterium sp.]